MGKERAAEPEGGPPGDNDAVQFRPGVAFGRLLSQLAAAWEVSRSEAVKRLALLAAHGFGLQDYQVIVGLANDELANSADFVRACDRARSVLEAARQMRDKAGEPPLGDKEALALLESVGPGLKFANLTAQAARQKKNRK